MSDYRRWLQWHESQTFERKSCYSGRPGARTRRGPDEVAVDIAETLCAMANADGGILLVGQENVRTDGGDGPREVTGVDYRQASLALLCDVPRRLLVPPLDETEVRQEWEDRLRVLIFSVRSSPFAHRLTDGRCLLRIGTHNVPYDQHVVAQLKQAQSPYERRLVSGASLGDLDDDALAWFAQRIGWTADPRGMLQEYHLLEGNLLNRAGLLLFARDPRRWHDHPEVTIVRYLGRERGLGEQYQAQPPLRIEKPLVRLVESVYEVLRERLRKRVGLQDLFFQEQLEYPTLVWQEAIVNAIAHRDYSLTGAGIEVWLFDDRMEVRSPGLPPDPITIEQLRAGRGAHYSRNPLIARSFTDCGYMREQGEGIPRMFQVMEATDLRPPELTIQDVRFVVTLRNTPVYDEEALRWLRRFAGLDLSQDQKRVLALAASRDKRFTSRDVQKKLGLDLYGASQLIKALIRKGVVRLRRKGGRVYEVVDPGEPEMLPDEVAALLPAFRRYERLPRRSLQVIWAVKPHRAYQRARALVEAGWLELEGTGRGAAYRLTDRTRNARVSRQNTTVSES